MEINGYRTGLVCTGFYEYRYGIRTPDNKEMSWGTSSEEGAEWFLQKFNEYGLLSLDALKNKKKYLDQWLALVEDAKQEASKYPFPEKRHGGYTPNLRTDLEDFINLWKEKTGFDWQEVNDIHWFYSAGKNHSFVYKELPDGKFRVWDVNNESLEAEFDTCRECKDWAYDLVKAEEQP